MGCCSTARLRYCPTSNYLMYSTRASRVESNFQCIILLLASLFVFRLLRLSFLLFNNSFSTHLLKVEQIICIHSSFILKFHLKGGKWKRKRLKYICNALGEEQMTLIFSQKNTCNYWIDYGILSIDIIPIKSTLIQSFVLFLCMLDSSERKDISHVRLKWKLSGVNWICVLCCACK